LPWIAVQTADGPFPDYVSGGAGGLGRYGEAMLGYALLQTGLRDASEPLVDAGLRAIGYALRHPERQEADHSVFEMFALAAAYNLAAKELAADPRFGALAPSWIQRLQTERPLRLRGSGTYRNKSIVEAVAVLELLRSGLRSAVPRSWLRNRPLARGRANRLINWTIPRRAPLRNSRAMLSDPPTQPLAYHALSLGFYARAVRLLGRDARRPARRTLVRGARASLALTAPDGDLAYVGRSQAQAWALPFTAYGVEAAARLARPRREARMRALAVRALTRLETSYVLTDGGLAIVPAFAEALPPWYGGIDRYAGAVPYSGLTIVGLNLAAELGRGRRVGTRISSDRNMAASITAQAGDMAVLRRGPVWLAVKRVRSNADLRYDFGLVGLKVAGPVGWQDVIPSRPHAIGPSLGPTLLAPGVEHEPAGRRIRASARAIRVIGRFQGAPGRTVFAYVPTSCGVELRFRGAPGAIYRYATFFPARAESHAEGDRTVVGAGQRVSASSPATMQFTSGFKSASEADLVRADLTFAADASGRVAIATCAS
jgi:hypothetical protein